MPVFSVVIPTYNRASRIRNALASVLAQTATDLEVLVMDDGSTDDTEEVVRSFGDPRVRYFWESNSGGPARPRNRGMALAEGEWIAFLDSDDRWHSDKLQAIAQAIAEDPSIDAVSHDERVIRASGQQAGRLAHGPYEPDFYRAMLVLGNRCSPSAMTIRKSFVRRHGLRFNEAEDHVIVEDYDFWLHMALAGARVRFIPTPLSDYLLQEDSISQDVDRYLKNLEVVLRDHVFNVQRFDADAQRLWKRVSLRLEIARARAKARNGQLVDAAARLIAIVASTPVGSVHYALARIQARCRGMRP